MQTYEPWERANRVYYIIFGTEPPALYDKSDGCECNDSIEMYLNMVPDDNERLEIRYLLDKLFPATPTKQTHE
jgi:hypothetical protein